MTDTTRPAFPVVALSGECHYGMTMREWYAGQALVGPVAAIVAKYDAQELAQLGGTEFIVQKAFSLADAMIEEGKK